MTDEDLSSVADEGAPPAPRPIDQALVDPIVAASCDPHAAAETSEQPSSPAMFAVDPVAACAHAASITDEVEALPELKRPRALLAAATRSAIIPRQGAADTERRPPQETTDGDPTTLAPFDAPRPKEETRRLAADHIFFYEAPGNNGFLSQWYDGPDGKFTIDGRRYSSAEQAMMAAKALHFGDLKTLDAIMTATDPATIKRLGRSVRPFDAIDWETVAYDHVRRINTAKFSQNDDLRARLLATGSRFLAEASPNDTTWGIGLDAATAAVTAPSEWRGANLLGVALMEVRDDLAPATLPPRIPVYGTRALENLVLSAATGEPDADAMMTDHDPIENRDAIYTDLPRNIKEALEGPDADKWYHAYDKMIRAFEANKTWRPMRKKDVPHGTPSFDLGTTLRKKRGTGLEKIRVHVNGQRINNERARRDGDALAEASTEHYRSSSPVASYESLCCQVAYAAVSGHVLLQDGINDF